MNLNHEQTQAALHKEGVLLVLAGPGSGKTAVITQRTRRLIEEGVPPESILVVTFTRAAARQMRERFLAATGQTRSAVTFGTFHSIFYGILRHAYGITSKNIAGDEERYAILREVLARSSMDVDDEKDLLDSLDREIGIVKNERIPLENYYSVSCPDAEFRRIYTRYEAALHAKRLLDFDDIMVYCYRLFERHPEILRGWQEKFAYILVDEFQDVNRLQYDILRMLALPQNNLFLVGDDDQSIYRFRGARPEIMLHVPKDFPDARQVILKQNYRCSGEIVRKSQNLIRHNRARFEKDLVTANPRGDALEIRGFDQESDQTEYLVESIRRDLKEGCPLREIAVLFRTNVGCRLTVGRLMEYNLPFTMRDVLPNLYDHWIARNLIAYMRLAAGPMTRRDFLAVMNRPNRYLSREACFEKEIVFDALYQFYEGKEWMCDRIERLEYDLKMLRRMPPYAAINYIRFSIGYDEYLKEYAAYRKLKVEELYDILKEIQESAKGYQTFDAWFSYMEEYGEKLKEQAEQIRNRADAVTVSTLHSVKGLEYERVYILDVNEKMIPWQKATMAQEIEEERRLFYVGMTRAKKKLHLYWVRERFGKKMDESRFLKELETEQEDGK